MICVFSTSLYDPTKSTAEERMRSANDVTANSFVKILKIFVDIGTAGKSLVSVTNF